MAPKKPPRRRRSPASKARPKSVATEANRHLRDFGGGAAGRPDNLIRTKSQVPAETEVERGLCGLPSALGRPVRAGRRPEVSAVRAAHGEVGAGTARMPAWLGGNLAVTVLTRVLAEVVSAAAARYAEVVIRPL